MNDARQILRPRPVLKLPTANQPDADLGLLRRAIASRTCVVATYNRGRVKLAPYVLYERDDAVFVDAVTIERDGKEPREPKLGAFRLSGLNDMHGTFERFDPQLEVPLADERYGGGVVARL